MIFRRLFNQPPRKWTLWCFGLAFLGLAAVTNAATPFASQDRSSPVAGIQPRTQVTVPKELFEIVKLVDGDTLHIQRNGKTEKLRLLSVDTEEKLSPGMQSSATKPQTVFGEETRLWTESFFEQYRGEDGKIRVGLAFPNGVEANDVYGRLLCHVLTADGTDFNLLLVKLGKSPYFNKYGNSDICHEAFVAAQVEARHNLLGIWNPRTNRPEDPETPAAVRPYAQLLPWWNARAEAIDNYRTATRTSSSSVISAEEPTQLAKAQESGAEVEVFGTPDRLFEEKDGSLTVLMRTSDKNAALRVSIPAESRAAFEAFDFDGLQAEYRQNYVFVRGKIEQGKRGFQLVTKSPKAWRLAGPEPRS